MMVHKDFQIGGGVRWQGVVFLLIILSMRAIKKCAVLRME